MNQVLLAVLLSITAAKKGAPPPPPAPAAEPQAPFLAIGAQAPTFTLPLYNATAGKPVLALGSMVGSDAEDTSAKVVLVSFMASWCKPCKKELPFLQQLSSKYGDQGLRVVVISIDTEEKGQEEVRQLIEKNKITVPVLKDRFNFVARRWLGDKSPLPSLFFVDKSGKIALASAGYEKDATTFLDNEVQKALAPAPVAGEAAK